MGSAFVDEVKGLLAQYGRLSRSARQAVGYQEVLDYLDGARDLEETIDLVKTRTRHFAKHQETWFHSLAECRPVPMGADVQPQQLATNIVTQGKLRD